MTRAYSVFVPPMTVVPAQAGIQSLLPEQRDLQSYRT